MSSSSSSSSRATAVHGEGLVPTPVTCTICQEDVTDNCASLEHSCSHQFHTDCIRAWAATFLKGNKGQCKCPNCKAPFTTIIAFDGTKFVIDVRGEPEEWEEDDEDEEDEEGSEYDDDDDNNDDDGNAAGGDRFERCVECTAQVTRETPNIHRCANPRCSAAIHEHCLDQQQHFQVALVAQWRCGPCLTRTSRAEALERRRREQHLAAQRRVLLANMQRMQQEQLRGQRQALRTQRAAQQQPSRQHQHQHPRQTQSSSSSASSSSSHRGAPQVAPSLQMLRESVALARGATALLEADDLRSAVYYVTSAEDLQQSFTEAKERASRRQAQPSKPSQASQVKAPPPVPVSKKRLLTSALALEAQRAIQQAEKEKEKEKGNEKERGARVAVAGQVPASSSSLMKRMRTSRIVGRTETEEDVPEEAPKWQL